MVSSSLVCGGVGVWELDESNGWNMARVSKGRADLNTEQHGEEKLSVYHAHPREGLT